MYINKKEEPILKKCGFGISVENKQHSFYGSTEYKTIFGEFVKPEKDLYFKINLKSRQDSIGRLVEINVPMSTYRPDEKDYTNRKYILEFDQNRNTPGFDFHNLEFLDDYTGPTVWNFITKKHNKAPELKNKYGQLLAQDEFIIAIGGRKGYPHIAIGNISRWSKSSIWIKPYGSFGKITNETKEDVQITNYKETIVLPNETDLQEHLLSLLLMSNM